MLVRVAAITFFTLIAALDSAAAAPAASAIPKSISLPGKTSAMPAGRPTVAPFAHIMFCQSNPSHCRSGGGRGAAKLTARTWTKITAVNARVNRSIQPVNDNPNRDTWSVSPRKGDCEDFALTKRAKLLRAGLKPSQLIIATARVPGVGNHAVLVVRTDRGDFVLDNLTNKIRPWSRTGYRWLKKQSAENPKRWVSL